MGKGLFDKNKEDDKYFNQHEHATLMEGRIPGSWMVSLNIYFSLDLLHLSSNEIIQMKYCNLTSNFLPSSLAPKLLVDSAESDLSK